jgi:hypothetical protein
MSTDYFPRLSSISDDNESESECHSAIVHFNFDYNANIVLFDIYTVIVKSSYTPNFYYTNGLFWNIGMFLELCLGQWGSF